MRIKSVAKRCLQECSTEINHEISLTINDNCSNKTDENCVNQGLTIDANNNNNKDLHHSVASIGDANDKNKMVSLQILDKQSETTSSSCHPPPPAPISPPQKSRVSTAKRPRLSNTTHDSASKNCTQKQQKVSPLTTATSTTSSTTTHTTSSDKEIASSNPVLALTTQWYEENVSLSAALKEIDNVSAASLHTALHVTRRCLTSFVSDLLQFEREIHSAAAHSSSSVVSSCSSKSSSSASNPVAAAAQRDPVRIFKAIYRHHLFNRMCRIGARIEEETAAAATSEAVEKDSKYKTSEVSSNYCSTEVIPTIDLTD